MAIIGAGIAGISTGCYLQMNGYDTQIFEMGKLPGGLCTSWKKEDYIFDGCIHWLTGTKSGSPFYFMWDELGVLKERNVIYPEVFKQTEFGDKVFTDIDRFEDS